MQDTVRPRFFYNAEPLKWQRQLPEATYACMAGLRDEIKGFMRVAAVPPTYADTYCLSLCEVISNLVKHPAQKSRMLCLTLDILPDGLRLDIADDSTPFASFDAICKTAQKNLRCTETWAENGYGLGCILSQHTRVFYTPAPQSHDGKNHFVIEDDFFMPADKNNAPQPAEQAKKHMHIHASKVTADTAIRPVVFLVDDNPDDLKIQHRLLAAHYDVVPLPDAAAALNLLATQRPDLIISDLHMPVTDGIGLRRKISALPDGDLIPFIFLTSSAAGMNDPHILRLGIDDYVMKPASEKNLQQVTARVLGRQKQLHRAIEGRFHRDLEKYLHPCLPQQSGPWEIATMNRMADAGGGDFTLYHETPDGMMAVLADVMGHGTEAKFFAYAGYLRSLFRATWKRAAPDTACFLQDLSHAVMDDDFLDGTMLTCQSLHLGTTGILDIASAGHPPPLLLRRDGRADFIPVEGPLAGMAGDIRYHAHQTQLNAGDKVIFATDGFFDVFARSDDAHRPVLLLPLLPALGTHSPPEAPQAPWNFFDEKQRQDSKPADDATLIIAAYGGPA